MKRTIISCLMAVGVWLTAAAANTVTLTSVQGHPGDEVEVAVALTGESAVTAIELLVPLGDMLRYVDGSAVLSTERADGHTLTAAEQDGKLSIVIFSPTLAPLKGADGELCRFKLKLGKEPADYTLTPEVVMSDASGNALTCSVESGVLTLLSPKIEVTTPTIDYGRVPIRSEYTHTLSVYNSGNEPLEVTGITFDNSDLTASPVPCTIAAGSTQDFVLTYAPLQRGTVTSNVTITSNAINPKAGKAVVTAQPFSVNELHVQRAEGISDEEVTVVLKMNNMEPIAGAQCEFILPEALNYVEGSAAAGIRCSGTDHRATGVVQGDKLTLLLYSASNTTLPEGDGELMTFRVRLDGTSGSYRLNPQEVVLSNATVENMTSATSGEYVVIKSPKFSGNSTLDMGDASVTQKATATYSIYNSGKVDLVINKVTFLAEGYAVEENLPLTIAPRKTETLTVSYTPTAEGEHKTTMQIYTNDPLNRMYSVAVSGKVYEPNRITVSGDNTKEGYHFSFGLDNYTEIVAIQMNVKWLPGMKTSMERMTATERLKGHSYLVTEIGNGLYQVLIYSMANTPVAGNSGELFTLDYTAAEGTIYQDTELRVTDIVLSDAKGNNYVSGDEVSARAVFTNFTLRFVVEDETISEQFVKKGSAIAAPKVADRVGYSFAWTGLQETMPAKDLTVTGSYTINSYDVVYMVDGEEYRRVSVPYGSELTALEAPTKEGHTFSGWSEVPETMPAEDVTINGSFTVNSYTITYMVDGEVYKTFLVEYGTEIPTVEAPVKEGYTFSKWRNSDKVEGEEPIEEVIREIDIANNADAMLYTNAPCTNTSWGDQFVGWHILFDGDPNTFFHSEYSDVESADGLDHYLRVDMGEGKTISKFTFTYTVRGDSYPYYTPTRIVVEGSDKADGEYTEIAILTDLPLEQASVYESGVLSNGIAYRYIRYRVTETSTNYKVHGHPYFYFAEFGMTEYSVKKLEESLMPAHDLVFEGSYTINKYLVTFKIGDEVIATCTLEYGAVIVAPEAPEKEGYTFNGWGEVAETVPANDLTYEGSYSINSYLLTYVVDGETVQTDSIAYGTVITLLEEPTKVGYTFSGWSETPEIMPADDVTISGTFTINKYLVTFKIGDEVIAADSLEYGAVIVAPEAPEKEGYTFNGWGEVAETVPANDLTYEGSYSINSYLLTYVVDGETVQTDSIAYGTVITLLEEPTKEGYTFRGWSEAPETMPAEDVTISGAFTVNKYLVTFKIGDEVVAADSLEYGATVVVPGAPEREGHTFNGWGEVAETVPANDLTYEGSYSVNSYLLTYTIDGETVQSDSVAYGTAITLLEEPTKEGYTFSGWSEAPETMPAGDVTISGTFTINIYKVYYYVGEELVHTAEVAYGEAIPEYIYEPTGEGDVFEGWVGDTYETMPAHDVTYVANITNGIDAMSTVNGQQTTVIYDLMGRKVTDTENLKGGVYIVNGRKVIVNN